jgi:hypothetical protein
MTTLGSSGQPVWILDLSVFFCTVLQSWSASLSLISRKSISPCPGFLNREYGYFLMLMRVFNLACQHMVRECYIVCKYIGNLSLIHNFLA